MARQTILYDAVTAANARAPRAQEAEAGAASLKKADDNFAELYAADTTNLAAAKAAIRDVYTVVFVDANTAATRRAAVLRAGTIMRISVVADAANGGAKTVFTASIGAVAVTHPALEVAVGAVAGDVSSAVPTAANVVAALDALTIASDGGGNTTMPVTVTIEVLPTL